MQQGGGREQGRTEQKLAQPPEDAFDIFDSLVADVKARIAFVESRFESHAVSHQRLEPICLAWTH